MADLSTLGLLAIIYNLDPFTQTLLFDLSKLNGETLFELKDAFHVLWDIQALDRVVSPSLSESLNGLNPSLMLRLLAATTHASLVDDQPILPNLDNVLSAICLIRYRFQTLLKFDDCKNINWEVTNKTVNEAIHGTLTSVDEICGFVVSRSRPRSDLASEEMETKLFICPQCLLVQLESSTVADHNSVRWRNSVNMLIVPNRLSSCPHCPKKVGFLALSDLRGVFGASLVVLELKDYDWIDNTDNLTLTCLVPESILPTQSVSVCVQGCVEGVQKGQTSLKPFMRVCWIEGFDLPILASISPARGSFKDLINAALGAFPSFTRPIMTILLTTLLAPNVSDLELKVAIVDGDPHILMKVARSMGASWLDLSDSGRIFGQVKSKADVWVEFTPLIMASKALFLHNVDQASVETSQRLYHVLHGDITITVPQSRRSLLMLDNKSSKRSVIVTADSAKLRLKPLLTVLRAVPLCLIFSTEVRKPSMGAASETELRALAAGVVAKAWQRRSTWTKDAADQLRRWIENFGDKCDPFRPPGASIARLARSVKSLAEAYSVLSGETKVSAETVRLLGECIMAAGSRGLAERSRIVQAKDDVSLERVRNHVGTTRRLGKSYGALLSAFQSELKCLETTDGDHWSLSNLHLLAARLLKESGNVRITPDQIVSQGERWYNSLSKMSHRL